MQSAAQEPAVVQYCALTELAFLPADLVGAGNATALQTLLQVA
jgi:hypothetical protein